MKKAAIYLFSAGLLIWLLIRWGQVTTATAVPQLTPTASPTSSCATATPTPMATLDPTPTPFPTATPCNFPPTVTPALTITPTPCPPNQPGSPNCSSTPQTTPPTPTPTPWVTAVFWATADVTTSDTVLEVGEVVSVTTSLTVAPGCIYPVFDLTLTQAGDDAPIFEPESVVVGPPVPMPQTITVTAVTSGTIFFNVLLYGERYCGDFWNWAYVGGQSGHVSVQAAPTGELPDLIISDITYNGGTPQCGTHPPDLGARVWVQNVGNAAAGSFVIEVNGNQQQTLPGLAAGEETSLVFGGALGPVTAVADATNLIAESNEGNNSLSTILPIPTQPPPCPPTPTPSYQQYLPITIK